MSFKTMMSSCDHAKAIEKICMANEFVTQLRAVLLPSLSNNNCSELARDMFEEALRSLNTALSDIRPINTVINSHSCGDKTDKISEKKRKNVSQKKVQGSSCKRSKGLNSWTTVTSVPHDDGHQWRKYGQKQIQKEQFIRNYHRCAYYRDQRCPARKTVQQKDNNVNGDPPQFIVTYIMQHTCNQLGITKSVPFIEDSRQASPVSRFESKPVVKNQSYVDNSSTEIFDDKSVQFIVESSHAGPVSSFESKPVVDNQSYNDNWSSVKDELERVLYTSMEELDDARMGGVNWELAIFGSTSEFDAWDHDGVDWGMTSHESIWDY